MGKRREITPEAAARKEMIRALLNSSDVNSTDVVMAAQIIILS